MDVQMPVLNGYDATSALRAAGLTLPVVAMTANVMEDDRRRAQAAGMNAHVAKPIDVEDLIGVLTGLVPSAAAPTGMAGAAPAPAPSASSASSAATAEPAPAAPVHPVAGAPATASALPGIDVDAALARLGGDREALTALLRRFEQSQGGTVDEVRALLAGGQRQQAAQALHRLRGVASRLSALAETALHHDNGTAGGGLDTVLDQLAASLAVVTASVRGMASTDQDIPAGNTDGSDLPQKLAELQGLLQNNNLKALEHFRELRPALAAAAQSGALAEAVETLDFSTAAKLVDIMLQRKESA
jgi:CheY-like chemotaxis protein